MKVTIIYGEVTVTFKNGSEQSWEDVNLDTIRIEGNTLVFESLERGVDTGHYLEWITVKIFTRNILFLESVKDKD